MALCNASPLDTSTAPAGLPSADFYRDNDSSQSYGVESFVSIKVKRVAAGINIDHNTVSFFRGYYF